MRNSSSLNPRSQIRRRNPRPLVVLRAAAPFLLANILATTSSGQPVGLHRISETERGRVTGDPLVNPGATPIQPQLPAAAHNAPGTREHEAERETWSQVRWTTAKLQLPGNARLQVPVAGASLLLLRASWPGQSDVTISVQKDSATLTSQKGRPEPGMMIATALVKVPSAGNVVISANGNSATTVTIHVGTGRAS